MRAPSAPPVSKRLTSRGERRGELGPAALRLERAPQRHERAEVVRIDAHRLGDRREREDDALARDPGLRAGGREHVGDVLGTPQSGG